MTKPKKQSAAAQAFDRSTVSDVMRRPTACKKLDDAHAALRAALAVMAEADKSERKHGEMCANCFSILDHHADCPRVAAVALVRAALGE